MTQSAKRANSARKTAEQTRLARWERRFHELLEFHRRHGHFAVPYHGETRKLYAWANRQRAVQQDGRLRPDQRRRLAAAGFPWRNPQNRRLERCWDGKYEELAEFHRRHGHCQVPHLDVNQRLYMWISGQRVAWRHNRLRADRVERLERLGFNGEYHSAMKEQKWTGHFDELVEFHRRHGHFNVLIHGVPAALRAWVRLQRYAHCCDQLDPGHRQRLEAAGFPWINPDSIFEQSWNRNFEQLAAHARATGHFRLTNELNGMSVWVKTQRVLKKLGRLRPDRQQRLEAVGFPWDYPGLQAWRDLENSAP